MTLLGAVGCGKRAVYPTRTQLPCEAADQRQSPRIFGDDLLKGEPAAAETRAYWTGQGEKPELPPVVFDHSFENLPRYELGPGDVLEVIYQLQNTKRDTPYRLEVMDEIEVSFVHTPKFDRRATVRTDGKVDLPLLGPVEVAGRTTTEVEEKLLEAYSDELKDPSIQVRVVRSNLAIEELKRAITTAPRGQSRLEPVRPDGYISLPLIGDVGVAGLSTQEASDKVIQAYRSSGVKDIDVTVVLLEVKSPVVYALGEVRNPGPLVVQGNTDLWRTIGLAGGFGDDADVRNVVVTKSRTGEEKRFVFDFVAWRRGRGQENIAIDRGDIIYVPKPTSRNIYVGGEVLKPGAFRLMPEEEVTVSQAVAMAGGIRDRAREGQILILRRSPQNDPIILVARMDEMFALKRYKDGDDVVPKDPLLMPGDVVFVPRRAVGDLDRFAGTWFKDGIWTIVPFNLNMNLNKSLD